MNYILSLTNKCNLNCSYCYEKRLNSILGSLDDDMAEKVIKFLNSKNDVNTLFLFGGEPMLMPDRIKQIRKNVKAKSYIITTNGTLLDENFIQWCINNCIKINFSHDGCEASSRGVLYEILDEKLKLLLKYQPDTVVQMVYGEDSLFSLYSNIMHLKNLGVKKLHVTLNSFTDPENIEEFAENMKIVWEQISDISDLHIIQLTEKEKMVKGKEKRICEVCKQNIFINWNGKIYPCVQFQNLDDFECGDVVNGLDISKTLKRHPDYSKMALKCDDCEIKKYCHNACACRKASSTGGLKDISEAICIEEQVLILTVLNKIRRLNQ